MFDSEVRAIWLFFYLIFLDEEKATIAASKASDLFFQKIKKSPQTKPSLVVISVTQKIFQKFKKDAELLDFEKAIPANLSIWRKLRKQLPHENVLPIIWSLVLKFHVDEISESTGLTRGTIQHRISQSIEVLGEIAEVSKSNLGQI
jgi:hypothetical protein